MTKKEVARVYEILKSYADVNQIPIRSTSDLSPLEAYLLHIILKSNPPIDVPKIDMQWRKEQMTGIKERIYSYMKDTLLEDDNGKEYTYYNLERVIVYRKYSDDDIHVMGHGGHTTMTEEEFKNMITACYQYYQNMGTNND